jgi:uncharacterized protein YxeA
MLILQAQTLPVDFKLIISIVTGLLSILIALNTFWLKKFITDNENRFIELEKDIKDQKNKRDSDNKEMLMNLNSSVKQLGDKFECSINSLIDTFNKYNEKYREENFKLVLSHENIKKDIVGIDKKVDENLKFHKERIDKHGSKIEIMQTEIVIIKENLKSEK